MAFPSSLYLMKHYMDKHSSWKNLRKYVACYKCHTLYCFEDSYEKRGSQFLIKTCRHANKNGRICGTPLLKRIVTGNNKQHVYPHLQ